MKERIFYTQEKPIGEQKRQNNFEFFDFGSHMQKIPMSLNNSEQYRYRCQTQLKELIHYWLNYQKHLKHQQLSLGMSKIYSSLNHHEQAEHQFVDRKKYQQTYRQNDSNQQNPLSSQLIHRLFTDHPIFKKINFNLADTLINIGVFSLYKKNDQIPYMFYEQKHKNKCQENKKLGFIIYGKLKLHDKVNNYQKTIDRADSIGEHGIQTLGINFPDYRNVKVQSIADQTAILWISKHHYEILFKQSMKCGLKEEIKKLQAHLKLSWIKKSIKKF